MAYSTNKIINWPHFFQETKETFPRDKMYHFGARKKMERDD